MTDVTPQLRIKTECRGAHWISWVTRDDNEQPLDSVILVGQTEEEASTQALTWAEKLVADPVLIRS